VSVQCMGLMKCTTLMLSSTTSSVENRDKLLVQHCSTRARIGETNSEFDCRRSASIYIDVSVTGDAEWWRNIRCKLTSINI